MAQQVKNPPAMQETQEMWVQSQIREDPLEKEMATHSSMLAWRIPRTEEPGRLCSPWGPKESDTTEWLSTHFTQLTIGVWVYLWALYSVPLIYMSVFMSISCCFDYCSFVILLKFGRAMPPTFFFFFSLGLLWQFWVFYGSKWILRLFVLVLWRI